MTTLTPKQCRSARSLLKWNLHDLANRVKGVQPRRIDSFEHGTVHLVKWEIDELVDCLKKAGIRFKDMEVVLEKKQSDSAVPNASGGGEGERITLDGDLNVLSDSTAEKTHAASRGVEEEVSVEGEPTKKRN